METFLLFQTIRGIWAEENETFLGMPVFECETQGQTSTAQRSVGCYLVSPFIWEATSQCARPKGLGLEKNGQIEETFFLNMRLLVLILLFLKKQAFVLFKIQVSKSCTNEAFLSPGTNGIPFCIALLEDIFKKTVYDRRQIG